MCGKIGNFGVRRLAGGEAMEKLTRRRGGAEDV